MFQTNRALEAADMTGVSCNRLSSRRVSIHGVGSASQPGKVEDTKSSGKPPVEFAMCNGEK